MARGRSSSSLFAFGTRRHTGGFLAAITLWLMRLRTYLPLIVAAWVYFLLVGATGSHAAAITTVLSLAGLALFVYWRRRLSRAAGHLPFADVVVQLWSAWFLRKNWPRACDAASLSRRRNFIVPPLGRLRIKDDGTIVATINNGRYGIATETLAEEAGKMSQFLGCYEMSVADLRNSSRSPTSLPGRLSAAMGSRSGVSELRFFYDDPTGRLMRLSELPISPSGTVAYGRRRDGSAATIKANLSVGIGGLTGKGKTQIVWGMLADQLRKGDHLRLYVSDPKMGLELRELGEQEGIDHGRFEVRQYVTTSGDTIEMLKRVEQAMFARMRWMEKNGVKQHKPDKENPRVWVILDDALLLADLLKKGADTSLSKIAFAGRVAGYSLVLNFQDAHADVMGAFRRFVPQWICMGTRDSYTTDAILGPRSTAAGAECHLLTQPGIGYSYAEGDRRPQKFRAPLVTADEMAIIATGRVPEMRGEEVKDPHVVYRYWGILPVEDFPEFGGEEVLLYVGHTNDFSRRDREHSAEQGWYEYVTRKDATEVWPSKNKALEMESRAIDAERPIFNGTGNEDNPIRRTMKKIPWTDPRRDRNPHRKQKTTTGG